jgi:hypothetical protein
MGTRYYDPTEGRFTTKDVVFGNLLLPLSLNQFTYDTGNPVTWTDPDGLCGDPFTCPPPPHSPHSVKLSWGQLQDQADTAVRNAVFPHGSGAGQFSYVTPPKAAPKPAKPGKSMIQKITSFFRPVMRILGPALAMGGIQGEPGGLGPDAEDPFAGLPTDPVRGDNLTPAQFDEMQSWLRGDQSPATFLGPSSEHPAAVIGARADTAPYQSNPAYETVEKALGGKKWNIQRNDGWVASVGKRLMPVRVATPADSLAPGSVAARELLEFKRLGYSPSEGGTWLVPPMPVEQM